MATTNLRLTFGAMFIGCVISVSFSGVAALQAYLYFRQYRHRDSKRLKATVASVWILDIIHTILICQGIWHYLVLSWGDDEELDHLTWTVALSIAVTGFLTIVVQAFYANRVWQLSKRNVILTVIICALAIIRLGSALTTTAQMLRLKRFSTFIRDYRWLFTLGLALSCIIDVIITGSLCWYLQGSRTGYSSIDDVIHRLVLYTINNGLLTGFASILAMICAASMPHNFLFLSLHFIVAKCYINSLLATLNSRDALREKKDSVPMAVHISVDARTAQPRFFRRQVSQGHSPSASKEQTRSGGSGPFNGVSSIPLNPMSSVIENMKVRPKRDTFSSSIITKSPTEYSKHDKYSPPLSPSSTFTANSVSFDPHCYPPSPPPPLLNIHHPLPFPQVHIDVEQTIIRDDGQIIPDLNLHGSGGSDNGSDKGSGDDDYSDIEKKLPSLDASRMA